MFLVTQRRPGLDVAILPRAGHLLNVRGHKRKEDSMNKPKQFEWLKTLGMATVGLLMIAAEGVQAADDPVRVCEAAKIGAAGARSLCLTKEQAEARLGKPSHPAKCETKFDQAIAKIDAKAANHGVACRYVDNADGTISDLNTLHQWEKKTNDGSVHDVSNLYTWSARPCADVLEEGCLNKPQLYLPTGTAFTEFLGTLNYCVSTQLGETPPPSTGGFASHCDWRLPSIHELQAILLTQCTQSPCIDPVFGPTNITPNGDGYLSSTSGDLPHRYWYLNFDYNPINLIGTTYKDASNTPARAVRAGRGH
jgi:hypothetical protein